MTLEGFHPRPLAAAAASLLLWGASARAEDAPHEPLLDASAADWIDERGGALELKLAHDESSRPDGGILTIDPNQRLVLWEGIPGGLGCRRKVEAAFEDVRAVRVGSRVGFALEVGGSQPATLLLIPLPDAPWLVRATKLAGAIPTAARESLVGADGDAFIVSGGAAFAGPRLAQLDLPGEVVARTRLAVDRVREALGRAPSPGALLQEALHGRPVDVAIEELFEAPAAFDQRAVRLRGTITLSDDSYWLSEGTSRIAVRPLPAIATLVRSEAQQWQGHELEVTGVFGRRGEAEAREGMSYDVAFWEYVAPDAARARVKTGVRTMALADLVTTPGCADGELVRVVGSFRGRNLFGDLPESGRRSRSAWVVKSGRHAVRVTGRGPSGPGFKLDPDAREDTVNWLEIVGRPETRNGVTSLHAARVALVAPPSAAVGRRPRLRGRTGPPAIAFALPPDGEESLPDDTRFVVQFSKYMDEETFEGRVHFLYAGESYEFRRLKWRYDDPSRALIVDPGEPLRHGAGVQLQLLSGITDADGLALPPAGGQAGADVVAVLSYSLAP